jgi:NAD(P)-dependent dehydrogenase (short-subunit alcohol dehydrogenase family)
MKTVLITGASSGIGLESAKRLQAAGFHVIGTSRKARPDWPFPMLELDVDSEASARACVQKVFEMTGRIDVLINNAGYDLYAAAEETTEAELREQLETNFFGAVRMTQLVLPHMRERGSGTIIQLSSIGGLFALPWNSAYAASKFALEGYSEALRYELLPHGVFVSLIEPTGVKTESHASSLRQAKNPHPAYQQAARVAAELLEQQSQKSGLSLSAVADAVVRAASSPRPQLRYPIGTVTRVMPLVRALVPSVFEGMIASMFGRPKRSNASAITSS